MTKKYVITHFLIDRIGYVEAGLFTGHHNGGCVFSRDRGHGLGQNDRRPLRQRNWSISSVEIDISKREEKCAKEHNRIWTKNATGRTQKHGLFRTIFVSIADSF